MKAGPRSTSRERKVTISFRTSDPVASIEGIQRECNMGSALTNPPVSESALDREAAIDQPSVVRRERRSERATRLEPGAGSSHRDRTGHPDGPELLRVPLEPPAREREVLVDPDQDAAGECLPVIATADDHEAFLVLRPHGIEELLAAFGGRLPVGEDDGDGVGLIVRRFDADGQPRRDRARRGPVFERQHVAGVVPGRGGDDGGAPLGGTRREEPAQIRHAAYPTAGGDATDPRGRDTDDGHARR